MELLTPNEVATLLKVSEDTVLRRFADLPGCIDLGSPEVTRGPGRKRRYRVLRIPRAVLNRFLLENQVR